MRARHGILLACALAGVLTAVAPPARAEVDLARVRPTRAADCDALVFAHPDDFESWRCYRSIARQHQRWGEAVQRLEAYLAVDQENHLARLYLGWIEADRFRPRAEDLLREAAEGFARDENPRGEVYARLGRAKFLMHRGRAEDSDAEVRRADCVAEASGDPELRAQAGIQRAWNAYWRGDYSAALSTFNGLGAELIPDGPPRLQGDLHDGMGAAAWAAGRFGEAIDHYRRSVEQYRRMGDAYAESGSRYNILLVATRLVLAGEMSREDLNALASEALEAARRSGNRGVEAAVHLLLAQDREAPREDRIQRVETALALTRETGETREHCFALRLLADQLVAQDPERNRDRALTVLDEAIELATSTGSLRDLARAYVIRAGIGRRTGRREEAIADHLTAIETVEKMRDLQRDELVRARFLWNWTFLYYRAAGHLLEPTDQPPATEDAARAFAVIERLRSRILLDVLDTARASEAVLPEGEGRSEHGGLLEQIAEIQRWLLSPGLLEEEAETARAELGRLEALEAELRDRIARSDPSYALLRMPEIPAVEDLQPLLAPDQALLAFQLSTREITQAKWYWNGGSWVFLITRDAVEVMPLPDRDLIEERVAVFQGLLERRDELEREAAARLYEDLLSGPMTELPPEVTRLIVIPDGVLHRLSFASLRAAAHEVPLAGRYEISAAPSATLWHHWKSSAPGAIGHSALALADPLLASSGGEPGEERSAPAGVRDELGPLPRARGEARALVRSLGGESRLLTGTEASERFVKSADLDRYGVLHFATHALVDDGQPQRSAVVLAPGAPEEDGLLQMRDVVSLDLDGQVVILSACSSVSGELSAGEGVFGLARAFFQAGARAVVGSLWPLRDDEAAGLVEDLAEGLSRGESVGAALAEVRRQRIAAGVPTAAWAGLVVLGDADLVPYPGGRGFGFLPWILVPGALALIVLAILLARRRSRSPSV